MARFSFNFIPNTPNNPSVIDSPIAREATLRKLVYAHALKYLDTDDTNKVVGWLSSLEIKVPGRWGYIWQASLDTKRGRILITVRK